MTIARCRQVSLDATPYYHLTSGCVRRAFLCGLDQCAGKNLNHRKDWLKTRILCLSSIITIGYCAYAIIKKQLYLVDRVGRARAQGDRFVKLFNDGQLYERDDLAKWYALGGESDEVEAAVMAERTKLWCERLYDLSWFMRCISEPLARQIQ